MDFYKENISDIVQTIDFYIFSIRKIDISYINEKDIN
jgi:hypothetical protein